MTGILLAVAYVLAFLFIIHKHSFFDDKGLTRTHFKLLFILKLAAGLAFWAIYALYTPYQQRADTFLYFEDGKAIYHALTEDPLAYFKILAGWEDATTLLYTENTGHWNMVYIQGLYNESRTIIRFNALVCLFSFGHYAVHVIFMGFISFLGLTALYKGFSIYLSDRRKLLAAAVFLLPTVLFWGSGILKEGLILFSMGYLIFILFRLLEDGFNPYRLFMLFVFISLLSITKFYVLAMLFLPSLAFSWWKLGGERRVLLKFSAVFIVAFLALILFTGNRIPFKLMDKQRQSIYMAAGGVHLGDEKDKFIYISPDVPDPIIRLEEKPGYAKIRPGTPYISWYFQNYTDSQYVSSSVDTNTWWIYYDLEKAGSYYDIPLLYDSWTSVLKNAPQAFITSAFRPWPWEARKPVMLMAAAENLVLFLGILFIVVTFFRSSKPISVHLPIVLFCLLMAVQIFVLTGLTTPVLGSVVRYKMPGMIFIGIALISIWDQERWKFRV